ncbi:MAG TPA: hypothetical protein VHZ78_02415 [Rhizomicrobium sp.]|jgi:hypothetical protein|nr:hypothetical protein [Rhizomicrobium sp.]
MAYPTHSEWIASLSPDVRKSAFALIERFQALGADDPEGWARSEISEDIPQLARFAFLRTLWPQQINRWVDPASTEFDKYVALADSEPKAPFADAGAALKRVLALGAARSDIAAIARMVAYRTVFDLLAHIDEGCDPDRPAGLPGWTLIETDRNDHPTGRAVGGLHEDVLMLDPTGREGSPE